MRTEENIDLKRRVIDRVNDEFKLLEDKESNNKEKIKRDLTDESKKISKEHPLSLTNVCWLILATVFVYYSNIANIIFFEQKINRFDFLYQIFFCHSSI